MNAKTTRTFRLGRFGLAEDPVGAHVTLAWTGGRTLLGEVIACRVDFDNAARLTVRHFCGDLWPVEPTAGSVRVLDRDYTISPPQAGGVA